MAKKLADIQQQIESSSISFRETLEKALDYEILDFLKALNDKAKIYIFSGVIRDYFLNIKNFRDLDIVIDGAEDIDYLISQYQYRKNSFGGYKISISNVSIDLWFLKDTWALNHGGFLHFELEKKIPETAFFNFSSVLFSYDENRFIYTKDFLIFLRDKKIDMVYAPNANESLCVVNSIYYADKLHLKLGDRLKEHIKKLYRHTGNYEETQLKHFGEVLYPNDIIEQRIEFL